MYSTVMTQSLEMNKRFVETLSVVELDNMMKEFDNYEIEKQNFWFTDSDTFHNYLSNKYKKFELFKFFDKQERKSINLKEDIKQDLNKVLFF
ncbi:hypothetical protein [Flavobacterium sp.]|jgi:hypothetical protein|uniref:hypothetical protein n=1 Tax=Flavobacterium sp. TaxID=239 RepID=UPI002A80FA0C|nr:hypothetical protein [Flavobacterium sp.]